MSRPQLRLGGSLAFSAALLILGGAVLLVREQERRAQHADPQRAVAAGRQSCLGCHEASEGPGESSLHDARSLGCSRCHLGDPLALDKARAHAGLELEPGALQTVSQTCGQTGCHPTLADSVRGSLMATNRGLVSVDRVAFGELGRPSGGASLPEVLKKAHPSPAEDHLRRLCGGCHLGARRENRDSAIQFGGSGCGACHLASQAPEPPPLLGARHLVDSLPRPRRPHPRLVAAPGDAQCFGCHASSARISLSYRGWYESSQRSPPLGARHLVERPAGISTNPPLPRAGLGAGLGARHLASGRAVWPTQPDLHRSSGMSCIDCHLAAELMGDGVDHQHEEEQTSLRCEDCHGPGAREIPWGAIQDPQSLRLLSRRGLSPAPEAPVRVTGRGDAIWNLWPTSTTLPTWNLPGGEEPSLPVSNLGQSLKPTPGPNAAPSWVLYEKAKGRRHPVPPTPEDADHQRLGHQRLSCTSCHASHAPTCPSCHTGYDPQGSAWDFGVAAVTPGAWRETHQPFLLKQPGLALRGEGEILPAIPGMTMQLTQPDGSKNEVTLVSVLDPHATGPGRSCASCHRGARALGLGEGSLSFSAQGVTLSRTQLGGSRRAAGRSSTRPPPVPAPAKASAGTGQDLGWTTLWPQKPAKGTRPKVRGLNREEQLRILRVGACLGCHPPTDAIFKQFERAKQLRPSKARCIARRWSWLDENP